MRAGKGSHNTIQNSIQYTAEFKKKTQKTAKSKPNLDTTLLVEKKKSAVVWEKTQQNSLW